jgi:hypothetical protein
MLLVFLKVRRTENSAALDNLRYISRCSIRRYYVAILVDLGKGRLIVLLRVREAAHDEFDVYG